MKTNTLIRRFIETSIVCVLMAIAPAWCASAPEPALPPAEKLQRSYKNADGLEYTFSLSKHHADGTYTIYDCNKHLIHAEKAYPLAGYLAALESFLQEARAQGWPMEKIDAFIWVPLASSDVMREKLLRLAMEGRSRVPDNDTHYMSIFRKLVKEEKLLEPYRAVFRKVGLDVSDELDGDSKIWRDSVDVPGRRKPVSAFRKGAANLRIMPLPADAGSEKKDGMRD